MLSLIRNRDKQITIAIAGKYVQLPDAYLSINEALSHAGYYYGAKIHLKYVDTEFLTWDSCSTTFSDCDGILIPGGFGERGIEGMITACRYAREHNIPYFGICLGMQIAVIEFARNICGLNGANSGEFNPNSPYPVIDLMPDQYGNIPLGGTMRLGSYPCKVIPGTLLDTCYQQPLIYERHRHRYEFNNDYREILQEHGLVISGTSPDGRIVETVELPSSLHFIGVQFHPEFKSRPNKPHPLFLHFIKATLDHQQKK